MIRRAALDGGLIFAGMLALLIWIQAGSGAFTGDLAGHSDEAAHAVSSLLVTDYLAYGFPDHPMRFAERYYVHYPKVAIGHWPPLFYVLEGVWMRIFGRTKAVMLLLLAAIGAALAASVVLWTRKECGRLAAVSAGLLIATAPFIQTSVYMVMPDILLAALAFWAAAFWGRRLETGRTRDAMLFAAVTVAAIATHPRGLALALVPLVSGVCFPRSGSSRKRWLLIAIPVLLALCLPGLMRQTSRISPSALAANAADYLYRLGSQMGWAAAALALAGAIGVCRSWRDRPRWTAMVALVASGLLFHSLVGTPLENRYLVTAAPGVAALFAAGWMYSAKYLSRWPKASVAGLACITVFTLTVNAMRFVRKTDLGYHELVRRPSAVARDTAVSLVAGDSYHEGAFIAEMALADSRPEHIVLRGSKVLASSTWAGRNYRLKYPNSEAVREYLNGSGVGLAIAQTPGRPHAEQLLDAMRSDASNWTEVQTAGFLKGARVFERTGPPPARPAEIRIDMRDKFGKYFSLDD